MRFLTADYLFTLEGPPIEKGVLQISNQGEIIDFFYNKKDETIGDCSGNGVLSPVPGVIGTMMAVEALKYFVNIESDISRLHLYDAALSEFKSIKINKLDSCSICSSK